MSTPIEWRARPGEAGSVRSAETSGGCDVPLVSIGMPAYNSGRLIRQSLEALLTQDYENIELIVSDDGSTDETPEVCAEFARADPRIVMVDGTHRGERQNFNTVLRSARGKYFMWAADHDLWDARYVSVCVAALESDPTAVLAYAHTMLIDEEGRELGIMDDELDIHQARAVERYSALIWRLNACNAIYGLMRRDAVASTRGYGPTPGPDHLVLAKMALQGTFIQLPEVMWFRRETRPSETADEQRRRQPHDLDPSRAHQWLRRKDRDYFRGLRDGHIRAVLDAPIPITDKLRGVATTLSCFEHWFGVTATSLTIARRLAHYLPSSVREGMRRGS